jgi:hypothetical protein
MSRKIVKKRAVKPAEVVCEEGALNTQPTLWQRIKRWFGR